LIFAAFVFLSLYLYKPQKNAITPDDIRQTNQEYAQKKEGQIATRYRGGQGLQMYL